MQIFSFWHTLYIYIYIHLTIYNYVKQTPPILNQIIIYILNRFIIISESSRLMHYMILCFGESLNLTIKCTECVAVVILFTAMRNQIHINQMRRAVTLMSHHLNLLKTIRLLVMFRAHISWVFFKGALNRSSDGFVTTFSLCGKSHYSFF